MFYRIYRAIQYTYSFYSSKFSGPRIRLVLENYQDSSLESGTPSGCIIPTVVHQDLPNLQVAAAAEAEAAPGLHCKADSIWAGLLVGTADSQPAARRMAPQLALEEAVAVVAKDPANLAVEAVAPELLLAKSEQDGAGTAEGIALADSSSLAVETRTSLAAVVE